MDKAQFDEMQKARAIVINRLNGLEKEIALYLRHYFNPDDNKQEDFVNYLMNSSVVGFGQKVKLMNGLGLIEKNTSQKLMKLGAIRNGFAHTLYTLDYKEGLEIQELDYVLNVMNSEGKIVPKHWEEYSDEFIKIYNAINWEFTYEKLNIEFDKD